MILTAVYQDIFLDSLNELAIENTIQLNLLEKIRAAFLPTFAIYIPPDLKIEIKFDWGNSKRKRGIDMLTSFKVQRDPFTSLSPLFSPSHPLTFNAPTNPYK